MRRWFPGSVEGKRKGDAAHDVWPMHRDGRNPGREGDGLSCRREDAAPHGGCRGMQTGCETFHQPVKVLKMGELEIGVCQLIKIGFWLCRQGQVTLPSKHGHPISLQAS